MLNVTVIKPEVSYPKLRIFRKNDDYLIVLFKTDTIGIVVDSTFNEYSYFYAPIGHYSSTWNLKVFNDYDSEVVMTKAKYNLRYNNKNIIIIVESEKEKDNDIGFVLHGEDIGNIINININTNDYKIFEGMLILKNDP